MKMFVEIEISVEETPNCFSWNIFSLYFSNLTYGLQEISPFSQLWS